MAKYGMTVEVVVDATDEDEALDKVSKALGAIDGASHSLSDGPEEIDEDEDNENNNEEDDN